MNKDLTVGKPEKVLWAFCLPLFGSIIFQQLYNIADSLVAGKFIGENALAAVGNSYEITLIFIAFAFGCNIGCSVVVSRYFGAKLYADMKTAVHTTLISSGAVCAVLMALGLIFQQPLLQLIKTPEDVLADSSLYLDIYIWGLPFVFFYNISDGHLLGHGRFQNALYLPGLLLAVQHRHGYPVRHGVQYGRGGRCLGHLPVPGRSAACWRCALCCAGWRRSASRTSAHACFRGRILGQIVRHRRAEHFAAELYLGGQHRHPERDQQLWRQRNGRVFGGNQAQ